MTYPVGEPLQTLDLKVSDLHTVSVKTYGNPHGIPVVFVHGGPGGGAKPDCAKFFDPKKFYAVLFDQRGCGDSKPFAELKENTTWDLVADMEAIRTKLGIEKWYVFGGSWGSTLSLAYGVTHPDRCLGFVLRGIFLGTQREIEHLYMDGASRQYPEMFEEFLAPLKGNKDNLIERYYELLTSTDPSVRSEAAIAWSKWEACVSCLIPDLDKINDMTDDHFADAFARIECHFFRNDCFFDTDTFLLDNITKIAHLPCHIVHGRYDIVCMPETAWRLHKAWPGSVVEFPDNAGHASQEPKTEAALVAAMDRVGMGEGT